MEKETPFSEIRTAYVIGIFAIAVLLVMSFFA
jgi:hypothetical protein